MEEVFGKGRGRGVFQQSYLFSWFLKKYIWLYGGYFKRVQKGDVYVVDSLKDYRRDKGYLLSQ